MVKKISKILMVVALVTFSFQSFAQTFGVKAGLNMSKITGFKDAKMLLGFNLGATAEMEVADAFSVETGLVLSKKGVKQKEDGETFKESLVYLEIPINGKYGIDLGGKKLYFAAGPYLAFGVGGKWKYEGDGESESGSIKWGSKKEEGEIKRLDFGLNLGAGVEFGAIGINVQYGLGLTKISDADKAPKNRALGISLSYKFGK